MAQQDIKALLEKISSGNFTAEEERIAKYWLLKLDQENTTDLTDDELEEISREMWASLEGLKPNKPKIRQLWPRIAAAASIILCLGTGSYFYFHQKADRQQGAQNNPIKNDLLPGGNKAYLTLANGKRITLTGAANGQIAQQSGVTITKTADGQLVYQAASAGTVNANTEIKYNTIETPKGGQYQVILPDGSHVWLNAASSLKYPAAFAGNERKVELTGEAYFEVVHNSAQPFRVTTNGQVVEDIGTHFNINSYADEPATLTTLLEGSVKVNSNTILKPGEQAILFQTGNVLVKEVNTAEFVAWKNGLFQFDNASLVMVMRQLSRWYDVQIDYEGKIPSRTFTGKIHRDVNASEALEILKFTKVNFKIAGKKIIVTP